MSFLRFSETLIRIFLFTDKIKLVAYSDVVFCKSSFFIKFGFFQHEKENFIKGAIVLNYLSF